MPVPAIQMLKSLFGVTDEAEQEFAQEQPQGQPVLPVGSQPIIRPPSASAPRGALPANAQPASPQGGQPAGSSAGAPALAPAGQPPAAAPKLGQKDIDMEAKRAKSAASQHPEQAKQLTETLQKTGVDVDAAYKELFDSLGGVVKPDEKLSTEEKGMFLMSFGLRTMAMSENMSAGGAIGAAGAQTIQDVMGEKKSRVEAARTETEGRRKTALELLRERMRQRERSPATYDSATGLRAWNPDTGAWDLQRDPGTGAPIQPGLTPGGHTRDSVFQQKYQTLVQSGIDPKVAGVMAASNAKSPVEQFQELQLVYAKDPNIKIRGVKARDMSDEQLKAALWEMANSGWGMMYGGGGGGGGGGRPPPASAEEAPPGNLARPPGWDNY